MGMFSRMSDIVQANINALLDKAEDPVKVIRLIIQEMEETLVEVRGVAAKHIAEKKYTQRQLSSYEKQAADWHAKAQLAMDKGKEDLARAALVERQQVLHKVEGLQQQLTQIEENLGKLQEDTGRLNDKLAEAKAKQKSMTVRQQSVGARMQAKAVTYSDKIDSAMSRFDAYEQRIDELESKVEAYDLVASPAANSLEAQFRELEVDESVEKELAALKAKAA